MVDREIWPIRVVEGNGFRQLLNYIKRGYCVPSHTHIAPICGCGDDNEYPFVQDTINEILILPIRFKLFYS